MRDYKIEHQVYRLSRYSANMLISLDYNLKNKKMALNFKTFLSIKENITVIIIAFASIILHLGFNNDFGFHRDELLYFSLGQHLDFGYYSVPPFIGFMAFIATKLFGYTLFAARFFPAIMGGLIIVLSAQIAKELRGGAYAQILAAVSLAGSLLFVRAFGLFQPVCFDIFFWTLCMYLLIRYMNTENKKFILYFGLALGFGFLNKYNLIFLLIPVLIVLPFSKYRNLFITKQFYWAVTIALTILLPNIIWQLTHNLPVVDHMTELRSSQLVNMSVGLFILEQLLMIIPATLVGLAGLVYLLFAKRMKKYQLLSVISIIVLSLFILLQGKSYYSAGIYPMLIAAGAVFFEALLKRNIVRITFIVLIILVEWMFLPMGKPIYSPQKMVSYFDNMQDMSGNNDIRRYENNKYHELPQDFADMLGWNELTELTFKAWQKVENKQQCIIFGDSYAEASVICVLGKKYNLPNCLSFNDNFRFWNPATFDDEITDLIYINDEPGKDVKELFADIEQIGTITNPLAREFGLGVYLCRKPTRSFNAFWERIVKERAN